MKNTSMKALLLSAAMTGLLAGSAAAQTPSTNDGTSVKASNGSNVLLAKADKDKKDKHSCAGKNDCKGKGGCATDGSKMPS